jgi:hypothetical protein
MRQQTSAYVSIRQHTSAYVSIRQHTSAYGTCAFSSSSFTPCGFATSRDTLALSRGRRSWLSWVAAQLSDCAQWSSSYVFLLLLLFAVIINDILGGLSCSGTTRLLGIVGTTSGSSVAASLRASAKSSTSSSLSSFRAAFFLAVAGALLVTAALPFATIDALTNFLLSRPPDCEFKRSNSEAVAARYLCATGAGRN